MASLGEAYVSIIADTSDLESSLQDGLKAAVARTRLGTVYGSAVAAGVIKAIQAFAPLEKKILEVFQVQGINASDYMFDALADQIYDVAREIGQPAEAVGEAIALGVGRGFTQEEAVDLSKLAGQLSIALPDTVNVTDATRALTASLNGFNIEADKAEKVAGVLFQVLAKSGAPVGQIAQQIGNLAPAAANANIGLEETTAAVATLVQGGYTAAEATTLIRTAILELSDAQTTGGKVFKEISGKTFPEYTKAGGSLQSALNLINDASKSTKYSVSDLTSNINTQNAVIALTGEATARYTQNLADAQVGTEALSNATAQAERGALFQFNKSINEVKTSFQEVGGALRPLTDMLLARLTPALQWVSQQLQNLATWISGLDFSSLEGKLDLVVLGLQQFGMLFMAVFDILKGADWSSVFLAIQIAAAPVVVAFGLLAGAARVLAEMLQWATPFLREVAEYLSYLAPVVAIILLVAKAKAAWTLAVIALRVAMFALGPVIRGVITLITALRAAMIALGLATGIAMPWLYLIVGALAALAAGFIYAWKNSQQFREIVVSVFNNVKNAIVTFYETAATAWVNLARGFAEMAKNIVDIVAKVPVLGGPAKGVSEWLQQRISELNQVEAKIHQVANAARAMNWELSNFPSGWIHGNADQTGKTFNELWAEINGGSSKPKVTMPKFTTPKTSGLGSILDPKTSSKKAAKDQAKEALKRLKEAITDLYNDIVKFTRDIGEKSVDQIASGTESIVEKFNDQIAEATEQGQKSIAKKLKKGLSNFKSYSKELTKLAGKRDVLDEKLKTATDNLNELTRASKQFYDTTRMAFINLGKVSEGSAGIGVTFLGIRNNLRDAIRTTQQFNKAMMELQALGLNEDSLRQLADAGPEALDQARALARSGAKGVAEINRLQAELDKIATTTASNLDKEFYAAGISAAEGIVKGLQSQRDKIVAEMEKISEAMVKAMKKTLGIKSPSRVFDELGREVPAGMAQGVRRGTPDVAKAIAAMSSQRSTTGVDVGGVTINGVADPEAARRAGILAGEAIGATLAKRRTAQILTGVA